MLRFSPAVFAVGDCYQIIVTSKSQAFISIKVGNKIFVDDSNGILRSACKTHKFNIPMQLLNETKHYTVIEKHIIKRLPYFTQTGKDKFYEYDFYPVPQKNQRAFHIADAHNETEGPVNAGKKYGKFDFLILNGDIPNHSGTVENFATVFEICSLLTEGQKPVVFARGNHDLRGICAEKFAEYTPSLNGKTYYTWRLGSIWGICLDCGEDKPDDHEEYGNTVCCHIFRERETEFLEEIIKSEEYKAPGIDTRLVICHNPFTFKFEEPFNIEKEIYTHWARLLKENIKPDLMICGHTHTYALRYPGDESDYKGHPCPLVTASQRGNDIPFGGAGFEFGEKNIKIDFVNSINPNLDKITVKKEK